MLHVTKADGRRQIFEKEKIARTCIRMGASNEEARNIADKIEEKLKDGTETKKILQMIFSELENYRPEVKHIIDLREAISLLRSKPDFEKFVGAILKSQGYQVQMNQIVAGKCVDHEIDVIANNSSEIIYVEVKHHLQHHTFTGLDVFLEANSTFEDLCEGYLRGKNKIKFTRAVVVSNTKISDHAWRYSRCRGIDNIGWKSPPGDSLEDMIERNKLYPITLLKNLDRNEEEKLGDAEIILLRQLVEKDESEICSLTKIPKTRIAKLVLAAKEILGKIQIAAYSPTKTS